MEDSAPKKRFSTKGFTSLLLTSSFVVMGASGVVLYLTPRGRDAHWTNWSMLSLGKEEWGSLHINMSALFLIVAAVHLMLNWRVFWRYIAKRSVGGLSLKKEMALAGLIAATFVVGTIYSVPPFSTVMAWNTAIKDYWSRQAAQAPTAHAEELTLVEFARQISIAPDDAAAALRREGFDVADPAATLHQIASDGGVAPSELLDAIRKHHPQSAAPQEFHGGGRGMGRGMGMGMRGGQGGMGRGAGMGPGRSAQDGECTSSPHADTVSE